MWRSQTISLEADIIRSLFLIPNAAPVGSVDLIFLFGKPHSLLHQRTLLLFPGKTLLPIRRTIHDVRPAMTDIHVPGIDQPITVFAGVFAPVDPDNSRPRCTEIVLRNFPDVRGQRVLDAGTGTGVLAIKAIQEGASTAIAFDSNPIAVANARWNVQARGFTDKVEIHNANHKTHALQEWAQRSDILLSIAPTSDMSDEWAHTLHQLPVLLRGNTHDPENLLPRTVFRLPHLHTAIVGYPDQKRDELFGLIRPHGWELVHHYPPTSVDQRDAFGAFVLRRPQPLPHRQDSSSAFDFWMTFHPATATAGFRQKRHLLHAAA